MTAPLTPPYRAIAKGLMEGQVIPFLGAGASLGTRNPQKLKWENPSDGFLPTGPELTQYIANEVEFPKSEHLDLAKVAQYAQIIIGRGPLEQTLHEVFEGHGKPARIHKFIARIENPMLIVSTNYDDLLERALTDTKFDLVTHSIDQKGGDLYWREYGAKEQKRVKPKSLYIDLSSRTVVYKMHGSINPTDMSQEQYVITEDDYVEFLTRMARHDAIPHIFAEPFSKHAFLFLGYGLNDWNLRVVLNRIERDLGGRKNVTSWAIQYPLSPLEQRFWQDRNVEVYEDTIENFVFELEKRMQ